MRKVLTIAKEFLVAMLLLLAVLWAMVLLGGVGTVELTLWLIVAAVTITVIIVRQVKRT